MSLKHAIVGFLLERPMHGYQLKQALSPALGREGQVNDGILYPILNKLVLEGLVKKRIEKPASGPSRHVLSPTAKGERWFRAWLESGDGEDDSVTYDFFLSNPFLAKCVFFDGLDGKLMVNKLDAQLALATSKLKTFVEIRKRLLARHVSAHRIAVLDLGIAQQRTKIAWLRKQQRVATAKR